MRLSGSCLCGDINFECSGTPNWVAHCHCESCRKNCAAPFTSFFGMDNDKFEYISGQPNKFESAKGVTRAFCSKCGTPISYFNKKWPHETHFYLAALEDTSAIQPQYHVHWAERVPWIMVNDDLPKYEASAEEGKPIK